MHGQALIENELNSRTNSANMGDQTDSQVGSQAHASRKNS